MYIESKQKYSDIESLIALKKSSGETVTVAIPTLNEEKTLRKTISIIQNELLGSDKLVDELLVLDGGSDDKTVEIAKELNCKIYDVRDGKGGDSWKNGKGLALWRSQFLTNSSIIIFVDADIENFNSYFILGQIGALLEHKDCGFVKGYYKRPLKDATGNLVQNGGGRVTELLARPLLSRFYPDSAKIIQPLSGEYGFRVSYMNSLTFCTGYGVETSLLLDYCSKFGVDKIVQVNLGERIHRNRPLEDLGSMATVILKTFVEYAERDGIISKDKTGSDNYLKIRDGALSSTIIEQDILPTANEVTKDVT